MAKTLLVGSSFSAAPIYGALKRKGHHVAVCGGIKGDPCHQYADASVYVDYSSREDLLAAVKSGGYDFIVPTCNDTSYLSAAWVGGQLGYPGFDSFQTTEILHNKPLFRDFTRKIGLPVPAAVRVELGKADVAGKVRFPVLVKPADSFSGRGVTKVGLPDQLGPAIDAALAVSGDGSAVVEDFIDGTLHSHSAFIADQRIVLDFFVDEYCTVYPYQVNCSNHPSLLSDELRNHTRDVMAQLIAAFGLTDGLLHTQFMVRDNRIWIVECMRRAPGDLYGQFVGASTGIDYADLYARPFVGEKIPADITVSGPKLMARHTISGDTPRIVADFTVTAPARAVRIIPLKTSGELMRAAPHDKLAIVFAEFDTMDDMLKITACFQRYIVIQPLDVRCQ